MGTHPIFESDFDCLTDSHQRKKNEKTHNEKRRGQNCLDQVGQASRTRKGPKYSTPTIRANGPSPRSPKERPITIKISYKKTKEEKHRRCQAWSRAPAKGQQRGYNEAKARRFRINPSSKLQKKYNHMRIFLFPFLLFQHNNFATKKNNEMIKIILILFSTYSISVFIRNCRIFTTTKNNTYLHTFSFLFPKK